MSELDLAEQRGREVRRGRRGMQPPEDPDRDALRQSIQLNLGELGPLRSEKL
jgi:hypothetical protein